MIMYKLHCEDLAHFDYKLDDERNAIDDKREEERENEVQVTLLDPEATNAVMQAELDKDDVEDNVMYPIENDYESPYNKDGSLKEKPEGD